MESNMRKASLAALAALGFCAGICFAQQPAPAAVPVAPSPTTAPDSAAAVPAMPAEGAPAAPADEAPADAAPADAAAPAEAAASTQTLDAEIQGLKKDAIDLNRELFMLEEELLFPANTQVAVFLSMDVGEFFALDSVQLKVDDREVANYLYTQREADAVLKGGVHRVYLGNLKVGEHQLVAVFTGKGPNEREYRRGAQLKFTKAVGAKYLELKITDRQRRGQPEFEVKDWE
jgi:hypothetical protein